MNEDISKKSEEFVNYLKTGESKPWIEEEIKNVNSGDVKKEVLKIYEMESRLIFLEKQMRNLVTDERINKAIIQNGKMYRVYKNPIKYIQDCLMDNPIITIGILIFLMNMIN